MNGEDGKVGLTIEVDLEGWSKTWFGEKEGSEEVGKTKPKQSSPPLNSLPPASDRKSLSSCN